jgi:hypothetical protein
MGWLIGQASEPEVLRPVTVTLSGPHGHGHNVPAHLHNFTYSSFSLLRPRGTDLSLPARPQRSYVLANGLDLSTNYTGIDWLRTVVMQLWILGDVIQESVNEQVLSVSVEFR